MSCGKTLDGAYDIEADTLTVNESSDLKGLTIVEGPSIFQENINFQNQTTEKSIILSASLVSEDYILNLPAGQGTAGQILSTDGLGNSAWSTVSSTTGGVTYIAINTPGPFLHVNTGDTASTYSSATFNLTFGAPLATLNGGTGLTSIGTINQILTSTGSALTWQTPTFVTTVTASLPLTSSGGTTPNISIPSTTGSGSTVILQNSPSIQLPTITGALDATTFGGTLNVEGGIYSNSGFYILGNRDVTGKTTAAANVLTQPLFTATSATSITGCSTLFIPAFPSGAANVTIDPVTAYCLQTGGAILIGAVGESIFSGNVNLAGGGILAGVFNVAGSLSFVGGKITTSFSVIGSVTMLGLSVTNTASIFICNVTSFLNSENSFKSSGLETLITTTTATINSPTVYITATTTLQISSNYFNVDPLLTQIGTAVLKITSRDNLVISAPALFSLSSALFNVNDTLFKVSTAGISFVTDQFTITLGAIPSIWTISDLSIEGGILNLTSLFQVKNAETSIISTTKMGLEAALFTITSPLLTIKGATTQITTTTEFICDSPVITITSALLSLKGATTNIDTTAEVSIQSPFITIDSPLVALKGASTTINTSVDFLISSPLVNIDSSKFVYNNIIFSLTPISLSVLEVESIVLESNADLVLRSNGAMAITASVISITGSIELTGDVVVVGALLADDINVATIQAGNIDCGDILCGDMITGAIEAGDIGAGDIQCVALEAVEIICAIEEAGIIFGVPL